MLINEISKKTGLTKKAIEYYTMQGLIVPKIMENGYREYTAEDVELLKRIAVWRKLDISVEEIKDILADESEHVLLELSVRRELQLQRETEKKRILEDLAAGMDYETVREHLEAVDCSQTVTQKLLEAFPGFYGKFVCLHFAQFLNEPIRTQRQKRAYEAVIEFLDDMPPVEFPEELQDYLEKSAGNIGARQITQMVADIRESVENPEQFFQENGELLQWYLTYIQSDDYRESSAYRFKKFMQEFQRTSGYYDVFIPAIKELSSSYEAYYQRIEAANAKLLERYPEAEKI